MARILKTKFYRVHFAKRKDDSIDSSDRPSNIIKKATVWAKVVDFYDDILICALYNKDKVLLCSWAHLIKKELLTKSLNGD